MPRKISYLIVLQDKFSSIQKKVSRSAMQLRKDMKHIAKEALNVADNWKKMGGAMQSIGKKMSLFSVGVGAVGIAAVVASAKNETLLTSFKAISGSAETGKKLLDDLYTFAAKTPFEIEGLGAAAKMLLATGTGAESIIDTMSTLGDIASVSGGDVQGLARIWAQIGSMGSLETERANQLADRGIDIFGALSEKFGVSVPEVRQALEKKLITAEVAQNVLREMTEKGGVAFQAMALESATINGKWSNIKDTMSQTMMKIGDVIVKHLNLHKLMDRIGAALEYVKTNITRITDENPKLTKLALAFIGIMLVLGPIIALVGTLMVGWAGLAAMATAIGVGIGALIAIFGAIVIAVLIVSAVIAAVFVYWDELVYGFTASIDYIVQKWEGLKNMVSSGIGNLKSVFGFEGSVDTTSTNNTNIDVNLNGPKGAIKGASSKSEGSGNINVGLNMAGAT